jgi:MFS family permease
MSKATDTTDPTGSTRATAPVTDLASLSREQVNAPRTPVRWRRWLFSYDGFNLSTNTLFTSAIWVIYLASRGYSPLAIGLFEMLFHVAKLVMEVPTGIFADLIGRRKSLVIFCITGAVENLLFLVPTAPLLILSFSLSGISYAFLGGANEAMLWMLAGRVVGAENVDSANNARTAQRVRRYSGLISRMYMVGFVGEIIGTSLGGYLGHMLIALPFICRSAFMLLGILPLLLLPEHRGVTGQRTSPLAHLGRGLRAVWNMPALLGLLLISALTSSCWQTIYFYYQLYLHGLGFSLSTIGLIVAASTASGFLFTAVTPRIMRWLPERWLVPIFVLMEVAGLVCMSLAQPAISLFGYLVLFQASISVLTPATSTYINQRCPEEQRATVLSLNTGLFSATMIVLFPLFGLGITNVAYSAVYQWTSAALLLGGISIFALVWIISKRRPRPDYF